MIDIGLSPLVRVNKAAPLSEQIVQLESQIFQLKEQLEFALSSVPEGGNTVISESEGVNQLIESFTLIMTELQRKVVSLSNQLVKVVEDLQKMQDLMEGSAWKQVNIGTETIQVLSKESNT